MAWWYHDLTSASGGTEGEMGVHGWGRGNLMNTAATPTADGGAGQHRHELALAARTGRPARRAAAPNAWRRTPPDAPICASIGRARMSETSVL